MKLRLRYARPGGAASDIAVAFDATATVGDLADAIARRDPLPGRVTVPTPTIAVQHLTGWRALDARTPVAEAGIASGQAVSLAPTGTSRHPDSPSQPVLTVRVESGPDLGREFHLPVGPALVGRDRDCDVRLTDPLVSKRHARLNVSDTVEIVDLGSSNGVEIRGELVTRSGLVSGDSVVLGDTTLAFTVTAATPSRAGGDGVVQFTRSPQIEPVPDEVRLSPPEIPSRPRTTAFPVIALLLPILMAGATLAVTRNAASLLFIAFTPLMMMGNAFESRWQGKRAFRSAVEQFRNDLQMLGSELDAARTREREARLRQHPATSDVVGWVRTLDARMWSRRPDRPRFGEVRLAVGRRPAWYGVEVPTTPRGDLGLVRELQALVTSHRDIDGVPVVAALTECGNVGVAGADTRAREVANGILWQLVGLHSPAELSIAVAVGPAGAHDWDWVKWLPHSEDVAGLLQGVSSLAATASSTAALLAAAEQLVDERLEHRAPNGEAPVPMLVLLVDSAAPVEPARLVALGERGPRAGVHLLWVAPSVAQLPAVCRVFVDLERDSVVGLVDAGERVDPATVESVSHAESEELARRLSPVVDVGALTDDQSDIPRAVSLLALTGAELASSTSDVAERWRQSGSLPVAPGEDGSHRRETTLRVLVGQTATDLMQLDLRRDGPHALVGGTTGSGKSEFLQTWILGMAATHSPDRLTFLLIDYKGGSAFADCVRLPHCVGLVTDLSERLVRRALTSLNAELKYRETLLHAYGCKDLATMERAHRDAAPPSLVIVVDEFAALVSEVPEFVDGVVNVAQRGRSLGLHLILATQRPSGVIKDNLRANTNLRIALRMADEPDSVDVIGTNEAAFFDAEVPGRALARSGARRLPTFQTGYVGGVTSDRPPPPEIRIADNRIGAGTVWEQSTDDALAPRDLGVASDIVRVVDNIRATSEELAIPAPRRPWLDTLAPLYDLRKLPSPRNDEILTLGVADRPDEQSQPVFDFVPDSDGSMVVFGTSGAGKTAYLRTLAASAGLALARGGPCHVYAFDFAGRGLSMLEQLPHVGSVIAADDQERVVRTLRWLRALIDDRARLFASVQAGNLADYRRLSGRQEEPRILLLVDNLGAFRNVYEQGLLLRWFETFQSIAADGRQVGVHVVVTADRPGAVPSALSSAFQRRLVLRLANEMDLAVLGIRPDAFPEEAPPGRGILDGVEVQVALLGDDATVSGQSEAIARLAAAMRRAGAVEAPVIERLPERIALRALPREAGGRVSFAVEDEALQPVGFDRSGVFLVTGPAGSGRTTAVETMLGALRRVEPGIRAHLLASGPTPLAALPGWSTVASESGEVADAASALIDLATSGGWDDVPLLVVVEGVSEFVNSPADQPLQELLKQVRNRRKFAIVEGETGSVMSSWPLLVAARSGQSGVCLQPDQSDGMQIFKTPFPRVARSEFPPGRGLLVANGKATLVQVALPEMAEGEVSEGSSTH